MTEEQYIQMLSEIPQVQAVVRGEVPAIYAAPSVFGDQAETVIPYLQSVLPKISGLGATLAPQSGNLVVFNPGKVTEAQIFEADASGQLDSIATAVGQTAQAPVEAPAPVAGPQSLAAGILAPPGASPARPGTLSTPPPSQQTRPGAGTISNELSRRAL
jgi:hypothetical protein